MKKISKLLVVLLCVGGLLVGCDTDVISNEEKDTLVEALDDIAKAFDEASKSSDAADELEKEFDDEWNNISDDSSKEDDKEEEPDVLTIENSPMLAEILSSFDPSNDEHLQFIKDNWKKTVTFNGAIDAADMIEGKNTRMSMILRVGDYDENSVSGPTLRVKDIGIHGEPLEGIGGALCANAGLNVKVTGRLYEYDEKYGWIEFKLDKLESR